MKYIIKIETGDNRVDMPEYHHSRDLLLSPPHRVHT